MLLAYAFFAVRTAVQSFFLLSFEGQIERLLCSFYLFVMASIFGLRVFLFAIS